MGKKQNEQLEKITEQLEQGILKLFSSERYMEYLRVMSQFHRYSPSNIALITMQRPDATLVAGFRAWREKFGRTVKKGEKGIQILAPTPYKIKKEKKKLDPKTKLPIIGEDGEPVMEEQEVSIPFYRVVYVFDISQTEGRKLAGIDMDELAGNVKRYGDFFAALERVSPFPIMFMEIPGTARGYCDYSSKQIVVADGMSKLHNLKTAIHEIAHAKLHDVGSNDPKEAKIDRNTREVQALYPCFYNVDFLYYLP